MSALETVIRLQRVEPCLSLPWLASTAAVRNRMVTCRSLAILVRRIPISHEFADSSTMLADVARVADAPFAAARAQLASASSVTL